MKPCCGKYSDLIATKYEVIKTFCKNVYHHSTGENFNEDIFHDTLIKCMETLNDETCKNMDDTSLIKYTYSAYKTNMIREKQYSRTKLTTYTDKLPDVLIYDNIETNDILNNIHNRIVELYDEQTYDEFYDWIFNNKSVKEIETEYNDTKLTYKFKKINTIIKKEFGEDILNLNSNN